MAAYATAEHQRLAEDALREKNWKRWGPYLSERQWGTVREDYSANGDAWNSFSHDHARSRAYRWGEDGLLGFCDRQCRLCWAVALWNGNDPFLKDRLFGLTNPQGNHGEDVKEAWYYLDSTPTHSYWRSLYKYPQQAFPYQQLIDENGRRTRQDREFEIQDTGIFDQQQYFDISVEVAKAEPEDILIRITIENRASTASTVHVLPTLWFRNTWSWGNVYGAVEKRPEMRLIDSKTICAVHETLGEFVYELESEAPVLFTENETNTERVFGAPKLSGVVKDGFHDYVVHGRGECVRAEQGTKVAPHYVIDVPANGSAVLRMRLRCSEFRKEEPFVGFDELISQRRREADEFYATKIAPTLDADQQQVVRQAYAGLLSSKQYYGYIVKEWLDGDPAQPPPPPGHARIRNADWRHLYAGDVISMPDKWEYPWFAAWDLAFHMIPMARVDPDFAKEQLLLFLREWYLHPNGQLPAYEWNFGDVNPPVHAWACWRVYKIAAPPGERDASFLERAFQKLLLNFTWWVNRKDIHGRHVFSGGFLGLDNIGLFDRSRPLPGGQSLAQADGTAWMAFYCGTMLSMALELAKTRPAYEDIASKFFEHFVQIVDAMNEVGGCGLWDEEDGFYYDELYVEGRDPLALRVRSMVGLIPLFAVEVLEQATIAQLPGFNRRLQWFMKYRPDLAEHISGVEHCGPGGEQLFRLLAIPSRERLVRVLRYVLDEAEFLSPFGVRSLSKHYATNQYELQLDGEKHSIRYDPAESQSGMFGGNSNWRGPIWFPVNYLLIESLERYHHFYGDDLQVEFPTGSGQLLNLAQVAQELAKRLSKIFTLDENGRRPCFGDNFRYATDPHWRDHLLFHEYFHAEVGCGLGANHQTGWTALITRCLGIVGKIAAE
ncbi:MGH1-like glycoside hydrolase domain-containing protein [Verrucomicrobiota bacterium sgz303538]